MYNYVVKIVVITNTGMYKFIEITKIDIDKNYYRNYKKYHGQKLYK